MGMIKIHGVRSVNKRLYLPVQKEGRDGKSQRWWVTERTRPSRCNRKGTHGFAGCCSMQKLKTDITQHGGRTVGMKSHPSPRISHTPGQVPTQI